MLEMNKEIKVIQRKIKTSMPKKFINKPKARPKQEHAGLRRSLDSSIESLHNLKTEV